MDARRSARAGGAAASAANDDRHMVTASSRTAGSVLGSVHKARYRLVGPLEWLSRRQLGRAPPAGLDPIDAEPATISDFNGFVGLAYISGTVTRRTRSTGETVELPFLGSDMRFMAGVYRGVDGRVRRATFGFI